MNNIKPTDKAFPSDIYQNSGIDLRTYIATQAMAALIGNTATIMAFDEGCSAWTTGERVTKWAVQYADFLINELNKPQSNG